MNDDNNGRLNKEIEQVLDEIEQEKRRATPYWVMEEDYWGQPREVCVVDEINCLENEDAEIICGSEPKNERWISKLARAYGFDVERYQECRNLVRFIIRKRMITNRKEEGK